MQMSFPMLCSDIRELYMAMHVQNICNLEIMLIHISRFDT